MFENHAVRETIPYIIKLWYVRYSMTMNSSSKSMTLKE